MKKLITILFMLSGMNLFSQTVYYVKTTGSDNNNGASWATAFKTLQKAIGTISTGEIWVAKGTYYPDEGPGQGDNNRSSYFTLKAGVALYGGFAGTETTLGQRNWKINETILSGDIDKDHTDLNNAYSVVRSNSVNNTAIIDGFTITGGNAELPPSGPIVEYQGGGVKNENSSPTIRNCRLVGNHADVGGGIFNTHSSPLIINCSFIGNSGISNGGGISNWSSNASIINCTFFNNSSAYGGGGVYNMFSTTVISNCIIWGNTPSQVAGSATVSYSIVQGGLSGTENKNADPLFVNAAEGDLHLQFCSPAIEAGNNALVANVATDGDAAPRIVNKRVDMGAYESQESRTLYVKSTATGNRTGHSWTNAFIYLQDALAIGASCQSPVDIWVAAGTYYPDQSSLVHSNDPLASFELRNDVALYGGFEGTESDLSQRNLMANITILSGDVDGVEGNAHNSIHVVRSTGVNSTARLDGFYITAGNASGANIYGEGGGMYNDGGSPTVANCNFSQNNAAFLGGAMYNKNSSPAITDCGFFDNTADISGGAIFNESSSPVVTASEFYYNTATHYGGGGGIYNSSSSPLITACTFSANQALRGGGIANYGSSAPLISQCSFSNNRADNEGGGMFSQSSTPRLTNCTFWGNQAPKGAGANNYYSPATIMNCSFSQNIATEGGGIYNNSSSSTITNSILWDNSGGDISNLNSTPVVAYSIVHGGYAGTGNQDSDPMFTPDLHLKGCSPAINSATPTGAPANDLEGNSRPALGGYDMGAFEFQTGGSGTILYVDHKATGSHDGTSWTNAYTSLQDALNLAGTCFSATQIWVAAGTYYPDEGTGMTDNDRNASFVLKNGVAVYGGFAGTERDLTQRNWKINITILSGDIDHETEPTGNSGNAYHVVTITQLDSSAVLDGFTITGGNANGNGVNPDNSDMGGGILVNNSSPTITNCIIRSNHAQYYGGGLSNNYSYNLILTNCLFFGNSAQSGGGIANNDYASSTVVHCSFSNNNAIKGGAIYNMNASPRVSNSILWGNTGGQIAAARGALVTYSLVQDGYYPGGHNLQIDPLFVNQATGDLHLQACSPAIDAGNQSEARTKLDLDGEPRTVVIQTDMGAYEFQGTTIYVKKDAAGRADGTSWANAYTSLQDALAQPTGCSRLVTIWVAKGEYFPDEGTGLTNNDRAASFRLKNNTAILGGFAGTETSLSERNPASARYYQTILSGEIDGVTGNAGNAYHIIRAEGVDSSAVLDGFTIAGGNANGPTAPNNAGGGLYNNSLPTVRYCLFNANAATLGGAIYNTGAASLINCRYTQNKAIYGGAIFNQSSASAILNGLFWKNQASTQGGAIYNNAASPRIVNGSFNGNVAPTGTGGGIRNVSASAPTIANCILWGDTGGEISNASSTPIVTYSLVQGGYTGGSNVLNADPRFADAATGKLNLLNFPFPSPCIDAGNNEVVSLATDVNGDERIYNSIVDMGADEFYPGGVGGPEPLVLICPDNFTLPSDANSCGAIADYSGQHAATTTGAVPPVTITYDPAPGTFLSIGDVLVNVEAKDAFRTQTCSFWVTVMDTTAPVIVGLTATPSVLYPPNHKMQEILIQYQTNDCTPVTTTLSVSSNEPDYTANSGDKGPDWEIIDEHHVRLRAERSGNGTDRIYTFTITATDAAGNTATASTTVTVPHDNSALVKTKKELINGLKVQAIPNPTSDGFTILTQSSSGKTLTIQVTDNLGRIVEKRTGVLPNGTIYLGSHYRPGMYFMEIVQGDSLQTLKLLKQSR